mgnify:CR=1 FL=1
MAGVDLSGVAGPFEDLLALDPDGQAVRTVGLDYPGRGEDLRPLLDLDFPTRATVALAACGDYRCASVGQALDRLADLLDLSARLRRARRIVVKVGLVEARPPDQHVAPHPQVVAGLLDQLRRHAPPGATLCLAEGAGHERDTEYVLERTGLARVLAERDVPFVDLNVDDLVRVPVPEPVALREFMLPRTVVEADVVVSLAKLKTHHRAGVTLGMKNLFGCVPGAVYGFPKTKLHYTGTARAIADLASIIRPQLTVLDGVWAMEGTGPIDGRPRHVGVIIAGESAATTDAATARLMGFSPLLIPQFWYAMDKGLLSRPELCGDPVEPYQADFAAPDNITWLAGTASLPAAEVWALLERLLTTSRRALHKVRAGSRS